MGTALDSLGIIAGSFSLPLEIARLARAGGVKRLVVVGFEGETDPALEALVDELTYLRVGQLSKMIRYFKQQGISQVVMGGQVAPKNLFSVRPDLRAAALLFRLKEKNAHTIFGGIADELQKDGIELIEATPWLQPLMPVAGYLIGAKLKDEQEEDLAFGYRIAKEVSRLEIGQSVVVKEGTVLAAEGFEGTDRCLRRGGGLAGKKGGAVAVKVAKEDHDMRFDIPCIGAATVESCIESGVAVLGLEARRVIVLEREKIESIVAKHRFSIVTVS
ncbi:UDP-2,3-diacylglucosamine diphosphatase LpxI [bacterium]|jgi:UDP-2,3-diacylglucosamine hydrolase|nr:UDP-2,3-diacylglucosamine diphosphatase LpxI [bacterium]MDB4798853.1 UDP-2,3-diacylglucosamine diphosphatase LpxI [Verrucomicrobiota bacterium]